MKTDGIGMAVAILGERFDSKETSSVRVYVGRVETCASTKLFGDFTGASSWEITVSVDGRTESLTSITSTLESSASAGKATPGTLILVLSDSGQWIGIDLLSLCEGTV